jgi:hypothetical protein
MAEFDEYDHDFEPLVTCANCEETLENCECEEFEPEEKNEVDACNECELPEDDPTHVSSD